MSDQADDFLEHYGVKGMKWGKRKGSLSERAQGSASDRYARKEASLTKAAKRFEKPKNFKEAVKKSLLYGNVGVGPGRMLVEKNINKRLAKVQADKARVDSGKLKAKEYMNMSLASLAISVRPKDA